MKYFLSFLLFLSFGLCIAQTNDAGMWANIYLEKSIKKKYDVHLNLLARVLENYSQLGYAYADMGFGYRLNKNICFSLDYVYVKKRQLNGEYPTWHQFYGMVVFKKNIRRWRFLYRIMYQIQYKNNFYHEQNYNEGMVPGKVFRNKLTVKYSLTKRWTAYSAEELYYSLNYNHQYFYRSRTFVGIFYHLTKKSSVELYYVYQKGFNVYNPWNYYITGIGFSHEF